MIRRNRQNAQPVAQRIPELLGQAMSSLAPTTYCRVLVCRGNRMARHGIVVVTMKGWCVRVPPIPTYYFLDSD